MDLFLIFGTLLFTLAAFARMVGRDIRPYFRLALAAFFTVGLASLGFCDDLTTTAATVLKFDFQHITPQSLALLAVAIGACSVAGYFGGAKFEHVLEVWIMDHVPGGPWAKMAVPFILSLAGAWILNVSTGLTLAASIPGALMIAFKSMAVHASDDGHTSAAQVAKDAEGGK